MKLAMASDHGGFEQKEKIKNNLLMLGYEIEDFGVFNEESQDYPDFVYPACKSVVNGENEAAIILCGTGVGASIVANKVHGIRCALVTNVETARLTREHNDSNVIALAGRTTDFETNWNSVQTWLKTPFSEGERHKNRLHKIEIIEELED